MEHRRGGLDDTQQAQKQPRIGTSKCGTSCSCQWQRRAEEGYAENQEETKREKDCVSKAAVV